MIEPKRETHKSICLGFTKSEYEQLERLSQLLARSKTQTIRLAIHHWLTQHDERKPER